MAVSPRALAAAARPTDDRRLLDTVRPPGWANPEPKAFYDLVVVGAGTGGLVSAAIAAGLGARVALVERHLMGGDCLNFGCVPSKALLRAARAWAEARDAGERFGGPRVSGPARPRGWRSSIRSMSRARPTRTTASPTWRTA